MSGGRGGKPNPTSVIPFEDWSKVTGIFPGVSDGAGKVTHAGTLPKECDIFILTMLRDDRLSQEDTFDMRAMMIQMAQRMDEMTKAMVKLRSR